MRRAAAVLVLLLLIPILGADAGAEVRTQTFELPKGGGHPHDVAVGADGVVWYTAQRDGKLGRLDPRTGQVDLVPLGPGAAPHGVVIGPDGAPWVTEGGTNAIVRVDPTTRAVKSWPLPEGRGMVPNISGWPISERWRRLSTLRSTLTSSDGCQASRARPARTSRRPMSRRASSRSRWKPTPCRSRPASSTPS